MPIYLFWFPTAATASPLPTPAVQRERISLHILVLSHFILPLPGRSSQEWGLSDMIDCFAFLFASSNLEEFFFFHPFFPLRLVISFLATSLYLFFSKQGTLGSLVQKFPPPQLWNWFESLVYELVCFSHSLPRLNYCLPPTPPDPPSPACATPTQPKSFP